MCQIAAVSARSHCRDPGGDPFGLAAAVAFQVELGCERLVDRRDELPDRLQEPLACRLFLVFAGGADQGDAMGFQLPLQCGSSVALVGHEGMVRPVRGGVGVEHRQGGGSLVANLVAFGAGERGGDGEPRRGAGWVEAEAKKNPEFDARHPQLALHALAPWLVDFGAERARGHSPTRNSPICNRTAPLPL